MKKVYAVTAAIILLGLGITAQGAITIETVTVGNAGNAADTTGYGSVSYTYNIGKYEVTAGQYTAFLNSVAKTDTYGLYNGSMWASTDGCDIKRTGTAGNYSYSVVSDWSNRPVNYVGFWDSCRFANWLCNGQKSGEQDATTTERGAYTLDGYNGTDGRYIQRNAGCSWAVTSEDEWYKAAYYKSGSTKAGYWLYPTKSNTAPANKVLAADPGNSANYYISKYSIGSPYYLTNVGEFENSASAYGTFDQGGNVWEWNEAMPYISGSYAYRSMRGGSFSSKDIDLLASYRCYSPSYESNDFGFRVSQVYTPVPEPSSFVASLGLLTGLIGLRRRKG